jgi:hypothetical protein
MQAESEFATVLPVADAVLYEGYVLYPYRQSSVKNGVRWQFGVLLPRPWIETHGGVSDTVAGSAESWFQQTECLVEATDETVLRVRVRWLQLQRRTVEAVTPSGEYYGAQQLDVDGIVHRPFDEAVERESGLSIRIGDLLGSEREVGVAVPGGIFTEKLCEPSGQKVGLLRRQRWPLRATIRLSAERIEAPFPRLVRVRLTTENASSPDASGDPRHQALTRALIATHSLIGVTGGHFLSLLDPPDWAAPAASLCCNRYTFPVLAGNEDRSNVMLSSPIILYDHPRVAPESPGDLYDATEIDEILSLRTLTLTEDEKREARGTDARAAAIVDRVDDLPPEALARLHGAVRSLQPTTSEPPRILVNGLVVGPGSLVRLRPGGRRTDAQDIFLAGRMARVEEVLEDVDGQTQLAVTVADDPGRDLRRSFRRFFYFSPEEVDALEPTEDRT